MTLALTTVKLRQWQKDALDDFKSSNANDFLTVATPGAGKTTFALTAARVTLPNLIGRLVVVVPTKHLKQQWFESGLNFGFNLEQNWTAGQTLPSDVHGVITTYSQVSMDPSAFFELSQGGFVILDEIHHAGDEKTWGNGIKAAFDAASRRLCLSGTPFRSDTQAIPFVKYDSSEAVADFEYGYKNALTDGRVVRPVYFPRFGGAMEWTSPDGSLMSASFDDHLVINEANQRLRAALSLDGDWLPSVLAEANERLSHIRKSHPDAGGLVIAVDQEHARSIAGLIKKRFGISPKVVVSEDPQASKNISKFAKSKEPWLVSVRMVSEGVDIPRLRVGVYATTTTTELFFRQAVGRLVRHIRGSGMQRSYMFIPDDFRLRRYSFEIAESRKHSLDKKSATDDSQDRDYPQQEEQVSLFEVHSSEVLGAETPEAEDLFSFSDSKFDEEIEAEEPDHLILDLTTVPLPGGAVAANASVDGRGERERLRSINRSLVKDIVELTGKGHAEVNSMLNKTSGVTKIAEASVMQLNRRMREAEKWIKLVQRTG